MSKKPIKVDYSPSDFLGGTILLDVYEELAYRRICDLIYVMDGKLPDDKALADLTKMKKRWPKVRQRLLDLGKISVEKGVILNSRCVRELKKKRDQIEKAKKGADITNAKKRKETDNATPPAQRTAQRTPSDTHSASPCGSQPLTLNPIRESKTDRSISETAREDWLDIAEKCHRLAGIDPELQRDLGAADRNTVKAWLNAGAIPERHVYPTIDAWMEKRERNGEGPPDSLRYFSQGVHEAIKAVPAKPNGNGNGAARPSAEPPGNFTTTEKEQWTRVYLWIISRKADPDKWLEHTYGPCPLSFDSLTGDPIYNPRADISHEVAMNALSQARPAQ